MQTVHVLTKVYDLLLWIIPVLEKYPRTLQEDQEALQQLNVDLLFYPSESELYPVGRRATTRWTSMWRAGFETTTIRRRDPLSWWT